MSCTNRILTSPATTLWFLFDFLVMQNLIRPFFHILEIDSSRIVLDGIKDRIFVCILDSYETYRESISCLSSSHAEGESTEKPAFENIDLRYV